MDVVFEGALSSSWGMKDVLKAVSDVPNVPSGVLRVSCPGQSLQGKIVISEARHIVDASCNGSSPFHSYDALRVLLDVKEGNFAFLDLNQNELDPSLFIAIDKVLQRLPQLPRSSTELFDQQTLLDKVFGDEVDCSPNPAAPAAKEPAFNMPVPRSWMRRPKSEPAVDRSPAPVTQWNILEPLFNNPDATHTEHLDCSPAEHAEAPPSEIDEQRSSMVRLRALPTANSDFNLQRAVKGPGSLKWLLAALGLSLLAYLLAPQIFENCGMVKKQQVAQRP